MNLFRAASLAALLLSAAVAPASAAEPVIGVSVPGCPRLPSFWISVLYGVDTAAKADKAKLVTLSAGGDANSSQQISQIQDLIQRKVDTIIVGATNGDAVKAIVERAVAAGIPVVGISSPPNTDKLAAMVSADRPKAWASCRPRCPSQSHRRQGRSGDDGRSEWAGLVGPARARG